MNGSPTRFLILVIVCSLLFSLSKVNIAQAAVTNSYAWTTLQGDERRTGYTESPAPDSNQTYWKFQTGGPITSSPVASTGIVFIASTDGYLYAVNATNGAKIWDFWIGTDVNSPTVANGKVFITSASGTVHAINMYTGVEVWSKSLGEEAGFGAPLIVGSRVFVNGNQTVFAFNEAVGVSLYTAPIPHVNGIAPLAYDGTLIFAVTLREMQIGVNGFEAPDGTFRFSMFLAPSNIETVKSGVTISDENSFIVTTDGEDNSTLFALNDMGMKLWDIQLDGVTEASPAVAYNTLYIPTSNCAYALDAENGTVKWSRPLDGGYSVSSPAVADGKVYFGLDNNYVYALDAFTGDLIWSYKTEGAVQSSPAISDGLLFVGSSDGNLYAIGTPTIQVFNAGTWNDETYTVQVHSNLTVTDFMFNQSLKQITFNIGGSSGTTGFCNVTIPKGLLAGQYSVFAGESQPLVFDEQSNESHSFLSFNYTHSSNVVRIEGTEVIPEFPSWTPMVVLLITLTVALSIYKRRLTKKLIR
ncbi:MAG: PQQ-binding-like beta-propeller repeat protein [Candidatus Bathyarchaeota archaeon]|nr:PQQ-binding-like beta-propeller repeat protein [Candidatus Bathyarchaeota archaeon]